MGQGLVWWLASEGSVMGLTVSVVGAGYVGLPTAILVAAGGHDVVCVDIEEAVVRSINDGIPGRLEPALEELVADPDVRSRLRAAPVPSPADVFIIAVPTPLSGSGPSADLSSVVDASKSVIPHLRPGNLVILESTVPPLTCRETVIPLLETSGLTVGDELLFAYCPERVLPGNIYEELIRNDRIIGTSDAISAEAAASFYRIFAKGELHATDPLSAELAKLMENAYRDVNVALANEFAAVCQGLGIDASEVMGLANHHPRVNILSPGIGVGGHCIPIDPWFIAQVDPANSQLIAAARSVNDAVPARIARSVSNAVQDLNEPRIVALGGAYKANTSDTRGSPAIEVVRLLRKAGLAVDHHDPLVESLDLKGELVEICAGADCVVLLVGHDDLVRELDETEAEIMLAMNHPRILRF
jgi:UDP-N-acetyl-D-mannosaminuronic acid dehydrogenase